MTYRHGVFTTENPTSLTAPVTADSALPFVVGTAPINLGDEANVNKPVLCTSYAEAVAKFGYSDEWSDYTLCEFMYSQFALFATGPVVMVNVLDPATHKTDVSAKAATMVAGQVTLEDLGIIMSTVVVKVGEATKTLDTDYTLAFDDDGKLVITAKGEGIAQTATLAVDYSKLDPTAVDKDDIIGGVTGSAYTGLELINRVYPMFQKVVGQVLCPGYSHDPEVAAVMVAKARSINGVFKAIALTDIDTAADGGVDDYTEVSTWKSNNNYTSPGQYNCWPLVKLGAKTFHMSTQVAGLIGKTDAANKGIPYASPSNKSLQMTSAVDAAGNEIWLDGMQAASVNSVGVATALNNGGWKLWGNETGAYPTNTDVKDRFLANRRMFDWISNTLVLTYAQKVDSPTNRLLIDAVVDSVNLWLNGLANIGALLGGRVEFREDVNPTTDLLGGIIRFNIYSASPVPAQEIEFILEFDTSYLATLFA
jgi:phage tail sheath protein FI